MDLPITRSIRKGPEGWKIKQKDKLLVIRVWELAIRVSDAVLRTIRVWDIAIRVSYTVIRAIRVWNNSVRVWSPKSGKAQLHSYLEARTRFCGGWTILEKRREAFWELETQGLSEDSHVQEFFDNWRLTPQEIL
jgi:hypothetical protein